MLYSGSAVFFILLSLIFFTYAYHIALGIVVVAFVLLGLILTNKSTLQVNDSNVDINFELNSQGVCSFNGIEQYQLQASSRFSFLGCWLVLQPISAVTQMFNAKDNSQQTMLFIYRDSLSEQDFSRVVKVMSHLSH